MRQISRVQTRFFQRFFWIRILSAICFSVPAWADSVKSLKTADEQMRRTMVTMSRHLGVECTACHSQKDFASNAKPEFRVAKDHMRITQLLIDNGMDGKEKRPKADCYMCHRGAIKPDYIEKFDPMIMEKEKTKVPGSGPDEPSSSGPAED